MQTATLAFVSGVLAAAALVAAVAEYRAETARASGAAVPVERPLEAPPVLPLLAVRTVEEIPGGRSDAAGEVRFDGTGMDRFRIGEGPLFEPLPPLPIWCDSPSHR
jgi:hypothetical protein